MMLGRCNAWLLLATAGLLLPGCAQVLTVPCERPRISNLVAPAAYVVKLPLTMDVAPPADDPASRLDTLLDLQSIVLASEIESTHVTLLKAPARGECSIDDVYTAITENSTGLFWRRLFNSAVFLWGDVYEDRGQLYIQISVRVFWNGRDAVARVLDTSSPDAPPLEFIGRFPTATMAFPPRPLDARRVAERAERLDLLQRRAGAEAGTPSPTLKGRFIVTSFDGDSGIRLDAFDGRSLWLPSREIAEVAEGLFPELDFVRAVVAYLRFNATRSPRSARISVEALQRFEQYYGERYAWSPGVVLPLAIADLIRGSLNDARHLERQARSQQGALARMMGTPAEPAATLELELRDAPLDESESPETSYTNAGVRTPEDGDVLTLSALALIPDCCTGDRAHQRIAYITRALSKARQIDIASPEAATNLLHWYWRLARLDPEFRPIGAEELARRTAVLERALVP